MEYHFHREKRFNEAIALVFPKADAKNRVEAVSKNQIEYAVL